jgi:hypothetical protein
MDKPIYENMSELKKVVAEWKKRKIDQLEFIFSCGGDSMYDTELVFKNKNGNKLKIEDTHPLYVYFDKEVYNNVEFYEASDGHYIGESGIVYIELDDNKAGFVYTKTSKSEFSEHFTETAEIKLTEKQINFISKNVSNINGGYDESPIFNFKGDLLLTDEDEETLKELENLIENKVCNYEFTQEIQTNYSGGSSDWYSFTTNEEGKELEIIGECLLVEITREFIVFQDDEN